MTIVVRSWGSRVQIYTFVEEEVEKREAQSIERTIYTDLW